MAIRYADPMEATVRPSKARKPKTRANGEGSVYKLADGRYRATRTAGFAEGKQKIIAGTGPTRQLAIERREASWRKWLVSTGQAPIEILNKTTDVQKVMTVDDWFYKWHSGFNKTTTKEHYRRQVLSRIELHIAPAFGKTPLMLLSPEDINTWVHTTLPAKAKKDGSPLLSYNTISNIFGTLKLGLDVAVKQGHLTSNPAIRASKPEKKKPHIDMSRKKWVPLHLLKHLDGHEDECFYLLKIIYGLRMSEILGLTDDSFMLTGTTPRITVRTQLKRVVTEHGCGNRSGDGSFPCGKKTAGTCPQRLNEPGLYLDTPKSEAGIRTLELVEPVLTAVRKHMKEQKALRKTPEFQPRKGLESLFFTTPTGGPIVSNVATTKWHALLKEAKVDYLRGHDMRHLAATLLAEMGQDLETIKRILGHSTAAMSAQYVHVGVKVTSKPLGDLAKHMTQRVGKPTRTRKKSVAPTALPNPKPQTPNPQPPTLGWASPTNPLYPDMWVIDHISG